MYNDLQHYLDGQHVHADHQGNVEDHCTPLHHHDQGKLQFLVCPLFCPPVPSIELPSFFALVMPLNMPSTDILKCPLYILPFFNGMPSRGMLYFQMC